VQHPKPAEFVIETLLTPDVIGADGRNLHLVKPLHQFFAVFETGLVELTIGEKCLLALFVETVEPAGVQDHDVMFLDCHSLFLGGTE
jgi:hypothetical protein